MNDRFKFRMWDKYREEYIYFDFTSLSGALADIEVKIIEQCTGLKDNNGTLIYEGDIVYIAGQGDTIIDFHGYFDLLERVISGESGDIGGINGNIHDKGDVK